MNTVWFLWDIFINSLEYIFATVLLKQKLSYKKPNSKWIIIFVFFLITTQTFMNYMNMSNRIVMLVMYSAIMLFAFLLFSGTPAMRVMWASAIPVVFIFSNLSVYFIVTKIDFINVQLALTPSFSRLIPTTIYILICIFIFLLLNKIPNSKIDLPRNIQAVIIIVSILCTIISGLLQNSAGSPEFADEEYTLYALSCMALSIFLFGFFYIIHKTGEYFYQDIESKNQIQSMEAEKKHNEQMHTVISSWEHDQRHHIAVLSSYAEGNDIDSIKKYLYSMKTDLDLATTLINTGNIVLDAILSSKLHLCQSERIPLKIVASNVGSLPLSDTELSSMIGNILDNAIEACRVCKTANKPEFISFQIAKRKGMIIISTLNSSAGIYVFDEDNLLSSKKDAGHGYGIRRIKQIAKRANGFVHIEPLKDTFRIEVCIPILDGGNNDS